MPNSVNLSKSQLTAIILEAINAGAEAMALQLDADDAAKEVSTLVNTEGGSLIEHIASTAMTRYGQKNPSAEDKLPQYKEQFGEDFEVGFELDMFPQLDDHSYCHDICPRFAFKVDDQFYMLFTDYEDPDDREHDTTRYAILTATDHGDENNPDIVTDNVEPLFECEQASDITEQLNTMLNKA